MDLQLIVANLYTEAEENSSEEVKTKTKYVDETAIKVQAEEVETFTKHIKFTKKDSDDNKLSLLDFSGDPGKRNIEVARTKPTQIWSRVSVLRTLRHQVKHVPQSTGGNKKTV